MTDLERRAVIEYHIGKLVNLTVEPQLGYGIIKKDTIVVGLERALELAKTLEG